MSTRRWVSEKIMSRKRSKKLQKSKAKFLKFETYFANDLHVSKIDESVSMRA